MQIVAGIQGALLMGRLTGDSHFIDAVAGEFRSYLGYAPTAKTSRQRRKPKISAAAT
jgi:hypothetical protein